MKKKILDLAIPATIENILQTLVGFIDTFLVAQLGLVVVSAVGLTNTLLGVYLAVFIALGIGATSLIAQKIGANKMEEAIETAKQATLVSLLIGLFIGLITLVFSEQLLSIMRTDAQTIPYAKPFLLIVGGGSVFISLMTIFGAILRASGDTKSPMKMNAITNVINVVLDFILIFGFGPIPALGVVGTALGTLIARIVGSYLLYRKIVISKVGFKFIDIFKVKNNFKPLINLSIPAALERLVMRVGQVFYFGLIYAIGSTTFAAHSIAGTIEGVTYMPAMGLATAATTLVGNAVGKQDYDEAKQVTALSSKYSFIIMGFTSIIMYFGSPTFAAWFTNDLEAIRQIVIALRIYCLIMFPLSISLVLVASLQGMGDTKSPFYSTSIGIWVIRVVGVVLMGQRLGIAGVWLSILIDVTLRTIYLTYKFIKNIKERGRI